MTVIIRAWTKDGYSKDIIVEGEKGNLDPLVSDRASCPSQHGVAIFDPSAWPNPEGMRFELLLVPDPPKKRKKKGEV